ncbi:MAG: metal-dependent hydrolase [Candidatus Hodarchaeales archaeon]|jgi:membrane-bound metal-dependent hydrolase YbcI (DUF457 family)
MFILGHIGFSLLLASILKIYNKPAILLTFLFFSLLPDLDFFLFPFEFHRTMTHSVLFLLIVYVSLSKINKKQAKSAALGVSSHILIDLLDSGKIRLFYPLVAESGFNLWEAHDVFFTYISFETLLLEMLLLLGGIYSYKYSKKVKIST